MERRKGTVMINTTVAIELPTISFLKEGKFNPNLIS